MICMLTGCASQPVKESLKIGTGSVTTLKKDEITGNAIRTTYATVALKKDGTIAYVTFDTVENLISDSIEEGKEIETYKEQWNRYGSIKTIENWHQQIKTLEEWMNQKTPDEAIRIKTEELTDKIDMSVEEYLKAFEKAVEQADFVE